MTDYAALLKALASNKVRFLVVGGLAAVAHGSARLTQDVDVVYARDKANLRRIVGALSPYHPYPRDVPAGLPFQWSLETLSNGLNFTLTTDAGAIDLFGEIIGGGGFEDLHPHCIELTVFGCTIPCLGLRRLIEVKRAAGRGRDLEAIAELEALADEEERQ